MARDPDDMSVPDYVRADVRAGKHLDAPYDRERAALRVALWREIDQYVRVCGGDPCKFEDHGDAPSAELELRLSEVLADWLKAELLPALESAAKRKG